MTEQHTIVNPTVYIFDLDSLSNSQGVVDGDTFKLLYMLSERCRVAVISWKTFDEMRTMLPLDTIGFLSQGGNVADIMLGNETFPLWNKKLEKEDARYARKRAKQLLKGYNLEKDSSTFDESTNFISVFVSSILPRSESIELCLAFASEVDSRPDTAAYSCQLSPDCILRFSKSNVDDNLWDYFELIAQHQAVKNPQFIYADQSFGESAKYPSTLLSDESVKEYISDVITKYDRNKNNTIK